MENNNSKIILFQHKQKEYMALREVKEGKTQLN